MQKCDFQQAAFEKFFARLRFSQLKAPASSSDCDFGAKAEIHALIDQFVRQGTGVLLISSELPEVINLSSRVLVLRNGSVAAELPREQANQETLMRLMAGIPAAGAKSA